MRIILKNILAAFFIVFSSFHANGTNPVLPVELKSNYLVNPIGIGNSTPTFSWQITGTENNWLQSAYQIIVSTSPDLLSVEKCNVWNSGKVKGTESVCIPYLGRSTESEKRYYWKVKVWDKNDQPTQWSETALWETGVLNNVDWTAKWISRPDNDLQSEKKNIRWIWLANQDALDVPSKTKARFRLNLKLKEVPRSASLQTVARGTYDLYVNGNHVLTKGKEWQTFERQEIVGFLKPGENTIEVRVTAVRTSSFSQSTGKALAGNYAAFGALLKLVDKQGKTNTITTSEDSWLAKNEKESAWTKAKVVGELNNPALGLDPGPLSESAILLRKDFRIKKTVSSVRLYVAALGSYRMFINGQRVGNKVFTPEFTNYNKRITYQTYDISSLLKNGENTIGSLLGDGWYGSPFGWNGEYDLYQTGPNCLFAEVHINYNDGTTEKIVTDESWKAHSSPVLLSEIYAGEFYDARMEIPGWDKAGFNDKNWNKVEVNANFTKLLAAQLNNPVRVVKTVQPIEITKAGENRWLVDMGQNLVGWAKLKVKGSAGTVVRMRFAERLKNRDTIYVDNLRNATASDSYVLNGKGEEVYAPHFTFHGFRYIEVSGFPGTLTKENITAEVISSVDDVTGKIETSSPLVNSMYSLGIWGQRSNFISVPTDCPQRDERMGYTGDGQVFWRTGTYNYDIAAFTHKWMQDISDEQTVDGGFTNTAPAVPKNNRKNGSPGWEDAGVIVPWSSWMQYGDKSIIEENWTAMVRYMDYVAAKSANYIRPGGYLGDWLAPDGTTNNDLIATGLWGMTANMMAQMATATGKEKDAKNYAELRDKIKSAFQKSFIAADGKVETGSQTSYVIALHTGMVPDSLKNKVTDKLVNAIETANWHLTTGFLGTPYLLFALSDNGRADVAYRLLLNETYPSWGYMIKNGATTWWERWNSDKSDPTMNSFNHYAFGSVVEWAYRSMAGINTTADGAGFKKIKITPVFDKSGKITHAKGELKTVYGTISSEWKMTTANTVELKVNIPANTTAELVLPANTTLSKVLEGEFIAGTSEKKEMGSGQHVFEIKW
jgi:Glycogen debranching enzyme